MSCCLQPADTPAHTPTRPSAHTCALLPPPLYPCTPPFPLPYPCTPLHPPPRPPSQAPADVEETDELLLWDEEMAGVDPDLLPRRLITDFSIYNAEVGPGCVCGGGGGVRGWGGGLGGASVVCGPRACVCWGSSVELFGTAACCDKCRGQL
jgi:hypothetical protein